MNMSGLSFEEHLQQARQARQAGDHAEALEHFKHALRLRPSHSTLPIDMAMEQAALGCFEEADATFRDLLERLPESVPGWIHWAYLAQKQNRREDALACLRRALALQPEHATLPLDVAAELVRLERLEEARGMLLELVGRRPATVPAWTQLGVLARRLGQHEAALQHFLTAFALEPGHATLAVEIALELRGLERLPLAQAVLQAHVERRPESMPGWVHLAYLARRQGRPGEAAAYFRRALALQPDHATLPVDIAAALMEQGRLDEAQAELRALLQRLPGSVPGWIHLGFVARRQGRHGDAIAHFQQALALQPEHPSLPLDLAGWLLEQQRLEEARSVLEAFVVRRPDSCAGWILLGELARRQQRPEEASAHFGRALALEPARPGLLVDVAAGLRQLGRLQEARALLESRVGQHPEAGLLWHELGLIATYEGRDEEALACYRRGIAAQPSHPRCYLALAEHGLGRGRHDEVEAVLAQARARAEPSPHYDSVQLRVLRARGLYAEALDLARRLWAQHPGHVEHAFMLAELLTQTAAFEDAHALLAGLAVRSPQEAVHLLLLQARLAAARFDPQRAQALGLQALEQADDGQKPALYDFLAGVHLMRGDAQAAGRVLRQWQALLAHDANVHRRTSVKGCFHAILWQEMNTNPFAAKALSEALRLPPPQRPAALAHILDVEPGHVATAMAWLTGLRGHGALQHFEPSPQAGAPAAIPRRIVQFWDAVPVPQDVAVTMRSWPAHCAGFEYQVFDDEAAMAFIQAHCAPAVAQAFQMAAHPAMRSDVFRLAYLSVHGGLYADADDRCQQSVEDWLQPGLELLMVQEYTGSIGNNFLAVVPGHPFIAAALAAVVDNIVKGQGDYIWFVSGPGALSLAFCRHYRSFLEEGRLPPGVQVRAVHDMQRRVSMHLPRSYKHDARGWYSQVSGSRPIFRKPVTIRAARPRGDRKGSQAAATRTD